MKSPITVAIVGLGNRGMYAYGSRILERNDEIKVVAASDVDKGRLELMAKNHGIAPENCFNSADELLARPKLADMMFICTQNQHHYDNAIKALEKGYHILLEKPISPSLSECKKIEETAQKYNRKVVVCFVLRYTPFYSKLKEIIDSNVIGDIMTVNAEECLGYWHQAHSFVRGNWRDSNVTSSLILTNCCHDMDMLLWLTGKKCKKVSSFGSLKHFKAERAPEGAAERCFDCPEEVRSKCPYDCIKFYLDGPRGIKNGQVNWPQKIVSVKPTVENITESLKYGPYGRCVYHCDNNVIDNQIVNMLLEDDITVNFTTSAFNPTIKRTIRVRGCFGEILGDVEKHTITVTEYGKESVVYDTQNAASQKGGHGGGDAGLISSIIDLMAENKQTEAIPFIENSIESHFVALAAEESRVNGGNVIDMDEWRSKF